MTCLGGGSRDARIAVAPMMCPAGKMCCHFWPRSPNRNGARFVGGRRFLCCLPGVSRTREEQVFGGETSFMCELWWYVGG